MADVLADRPDLLHGRFNVKGRAWQDSGQRGTGQFRGRTPAQVDT
jgi:hypothetical protein